MCVPVPVMAGISLAMTLASTAMSAIGAQQSAAFQQSQANYSAQVARNNAQMQADLARNAEIAGNDQALIAGQKGAAQLGAERAAYAASGIDPNTGTPLTVQSDTARAGMFNQLTIRNNAARQALGYTIQSQSDTAQAELDTTKGEFASQAGTMQSFGSILSGVSGLSGSYVKFSQAGAFGGGGGTQQPGQ